MIQLQSNTGKGMPNRKGIFQKIFISVLAVSAIGSAETVGVFYDAAVPQFSFAAGDIKTALEAKGFTVETPGISTLSTAYPNKKVVIAMASNATVTNILTGQGGKLPSAVGAQAYSLRMTSQSQLSLWALGADTTGAMYGGLQIAENVNFNGLQASPDAEDAPKILQRGIKLNLPLDAKSTTYFNGNVSTGSRFAVANVWDLTFWKTWFDEMARHRYNVVSVWSNHHFTSMIKMKDYPDVAIKDVTGYPDYYNDNDRSGSVIKTMSIDEKIVFWQSVMSYAKSRGFSFYLINWNIFLYGAEGKYGLIRDAKNAATIAYMRKCMYELLKTYPDLDGFGVTQGEAMGEVTDDEKSEFLGSTYGKGMADYANEFPNRKLNFIHRWWFADFVTIQKTFADLLKCKNVTFDMSFKYSFAHMYSSTKPDFFTNDDIAFLKTNKINSWFTVRNDDFYYHNWGSPDYAREYIKNIPGQGDWFKGFYIGSDGNNPTRTFFSKNSVTQGGLEVQRQWYMFMIWGRLAYNPNLPDAVFQNMLKFKFPTVSSPDLYSAWNKVSRSLPKVGEMLFGDFKNDQSWYPENCQNDEGFLTITHFGAAKPRSSSAQCGIAATATKACGTKVSSFAIADEIEADALSAFSSVKNMGADANSHLGISLNTVKAMGFLNTYYAHKIRAATYLKEGAPSKAKLVTSLASAHCRWKDYTNLMDGMYKGMSMQRSFAFATWHQHDAAVLKEYQDNGGSGTPTCDVLVDIHDSALPAKMNIGITSFKTNGIIFNLPEAANVRILVFSSAGKIVYTHTLSQAKKGMNELQFSNRLNAGLHFVQIQAGKISTVGKIKVFAID